MKTPPNHELSETKFPVSLADVELSLHGAQEHGYADPRRIMLWTLEPQIRFTGVS